MYATRLSVVQYCSEFMRNTEFCMFGISQRTIKPEAYSGACTCSGGTFVRKFMFWDRNRDLGFGWIHVTKKKQELMATWTRNGQWLWYTGNLETNPRTAKIGQKLSGKIEKTIRSFSQEFVFQKRRDSHFLRFLVLRVYKAPPPH